MPTFVDPDGQLDVSHLGRPAPCPFCGNDGEETPLWLCGRPYDDGTGRVAYEVHCVRCHCNGPMQLSAEGAAYYWNRRAITMLTRAEYTAALFRFDAALAPSACNEGDSFH